jgi:hypothetical protein
MQIDAVTSIEIGSGGTVDVGGGGGEFYSGGGAGGNVIFESPSVDVEGIVAANGASGGDCSAYGLDATPNLTPAPPVAGCPSGPQNKTGESGAGGTALSPPTPGSAPLGAPGFAGGGAVGRFLITTATGSASEGSAAIESALVMTGTLVSQ